MVEDSFRKVHRDSYADSSLMSPNEEGEDSKKSSKMSSRRSTILEEGRHSFGGNMLKKKGEHGKSKKNQYLQVGKEIKVSFDDEEHFERNLKLIEGRKRSKTAQATKDTILSQAPPDYETDNSKNEEDKEGVNEE